MIMWPNNRRGIIAGIFDTGDASNSRDGELAPDGAGAAHELVANPVVLRKWLYREGYTPLAARVFPGQLEVRNTEICRQ
jgi:hypothetical protein